MNFVAIIGIVENLTESTLNDNRTLCIKVEKISQDHTDADWYDIVNVNLDKEMFQQEINNISRGCIIGIKGRIKFINEQMHLIGERVQVF
ncbi:MAG: hypothetical protein LBD63_03940 [Mycoplasmataceae bacterium]|jgi:hypothetical protein|nr:hypothetical protein [Mycoplasmataceae bacterium]